MIQEYLKRFFLMSVSCLLQNCLICWIFKNVSNNFKSVFQKIFLGVFQRCYKDAPSFRGVSWFLCVCFRWVLGNGLNGSNVLKWLSAENLYWLKTCHICEISIKSGEKHFCQIFGLSKLLTWQENGSQNGNTGWKFCSQNHLPNMHLALKIPTERESDKIIKQIWY